MPTNKNFYVLYTLFFLMVLFVIGFMNFEFANHQDLDWKLRGLSRTTQSLFLENTDSCNFIKVSKEQMRSIGWDIRRNSDDKIPSVVHLYACMSDFK